MTIRDFLRFHQGSRLVVLRAKRAAELQALRAAGMPGSWEAGKQGAGCPMSEVRCQKDPDGGEQQKENRYPRTLNPEPNRRQISRLRSASFAAASRCPRSDVGRGGLEASLAELPAWLWSNFAGQDDPTGRHARSGLSLTGAAIIKLSSQAKRCISFLLMLYFRMDFSRHFKQMASERNIMMDWVGAALENPDQTEDHQEGTRHYLKKIDENEGRWLRIIVNRKTTPPLAITAFFDRRLRRKSK